MMKKVNNERRAIVTIVVGALVSLILPAILIQPGGTISFTGKGEVGDVIGGIAGPVLNFAGLLVVYFSLQEQFKANQEQNDRFNEESKRIINDKDVSLFFKLSDSLKNEVERMDESLIKTNGSLLVIDNRWKILRGDNDDAKVLSIRNVLTNSYEDLIKLDEKKTLIGIFFI